MAYTYDQALALMVFSLSGFEARDYANRLLDFFNREYERQLTEYGKFIGFFDRYHINGTPYPEQGRLAGPQAYLLRIISHYYKYYLYYQYRPLAKAIADWLISLQDEEGGIYAGYDNFGNKLPWYSTEHNLAVFGGVDGFAEWVIGYGNPEYEYYHRAVVKSKGWLKNVVWDGKRFLAGKNDAKYVADTYTLGYLTFGRDYAGLLSKAEEIFKTTYSGITGIDLGGPGLLPDKDGVQFEFTAQLALGLRVSGDQKQGKFYLSEINKAIKVEKDFATLAQATNPSTPPYGDWHWDVQNPAIAALAWPYNVRS